MKAEESSGIPSQSTEGGHGVTLPQGKPELPTVEEASTFCLDQLIPLGVYLGLTKISLSSLKFPELRKTVIEALKKRILIAK